MTINEKIKNRRLEPVSYTHLLGLGADALDLQLVFLLDAQLLLALGLLSRPLLGGGPLGGCLLYTSRCV